MKKSFIILLLLLCPAFVLASDKVEINTASLQQLDDITGIGPVLAQRIIDARPFSSINDLLRVKGIGEKTLQKIKDQGLACVDCADSSLRGGSQADAAIHAPDQIASSPEAPRNNAIPAIYPSGVFINEILPSPEGADETEEYIELYNSNNFNVDLSGWKIEDTAGTKTSFLINKKILANEYLVFKRPETKIMLNNDGDELSLLSPDKKTKDHAVFDNAPLGQSYNRTDSGWSWSKSLTPGQANKIVLAGPKTSLKILPKDKDSVKNSDIEAENLTASLNQIVNKIEGTNPWFLFFTALAITIVSAIMVLTIKLKLNKNRVGT